MQMQTQAHVQVRTWPARCRTEWDRLRFSGSAPQPVVHQLLRWNPTQSPRWAYAVRLAPALARLTICARWRHPSAVWRLSRRRPPARGRFRLRRVAVQQQLGLFRLMTPAWRPPAAHLPLWARQALRRVARRPGCRSEPAVPEVLRQVQARNRASRADREQPLRPVSRWSCHAAASAVATRPWGWRRAQHRQGRARGRSAGRHRPKRKGPDLRVPARRWRDQLQRPARQSTADVPRWPAGIAARAMARALRWPWHPIAARPATRFAAV